MNKEILIYKGVMQRLTVSQNLQILHAIHKEVQAYAMRAPAIQPVFETFGTELFTSSDHNWALPGLTLSGLAGQHTPRPVRGR